MRQQDPEDCDEFQLLPTKKGRSSLSKESNWEYTYPHKNSNISRYRVELTCLSKPLDVLGKFN